MNSFLSIFRRGEIIKEIIPKSDAVMERTCGDFSSLTLEWVETEPFSLMVGDYVEIDGIRFYCFSVPKESKVNTGKYEYTAKLYGEEYLLKNTLFLFLDYQEGKVIESRAEFSLTATASEFLSLIVRNINRNVEANWTYHINNLEEDGETKTMDINGATCEDILERLCEEFDGEWKFDSVEKILYFADKDTLEHKTGIKLEYPINLASPFEVKHRENVVSRLFVFGSTRNLPKGYNDGDGGRLLMPNGQEKLETERYIHCEDVFVDDEVYPRRNSFIDRVQKKGEFFLVYDSTLDFDVNDQLQEGVTAKIAFNSGRLAGYTFDIASYDHRYKAIEIKQQTDGDVVIPNDTLRPEEGDKYVFIDIVMPDSYVRNAEQELYEKALKHFNDNCVDKVTAEVKLGKVWLAKNGRQFDIFDKVIIEVEGEDKEIRVTDVKKYPFRDSVYGQDTELTLSEFQTKSTIKQIRADLGEVGRKMYNEKKARKVEIDDIVRNADSLSDQVSWVNQ